MDRLFVYGIFLGERQRQKYGMTDPIYATVPGYATFGSYIVQARRVPVPGLQLTGLVVDVDPDKWRDIDRLEGGYDRVRVITTDREEVWMYAAPERIFSEQQ